VKQGTIRRVAEQARDVVTFLVITGSLVVSVAWVLIGADRPYGYTRSLVLFIVPLAALGWWWLRQRDRVLPKRAVRWTLAVLLPLGFVLDLLFANTFFRFPDHEAVLGHCTAGGSWWRSLPFCIPARGGGVPIEEFVFYLTGFMVVLFAYVWADELWLARYNVPDYVSAAAKLDRIVRFDRSALTLGLALLAAVFVLRETVGGDPSEGWPGYASYLIAAAVVPSVGLYRTVRDFINWRAFTFVFFHILLVSLLWEATLALPLGWWDYDPRWMVGIHIEEWADLPLEAVFVWLAVTFTTVIVYESVKIWLASGDSARRAYLGVGAPGGGRSRRSSPAPPAR
jgi:hypothetical protein